MYKMQCSWLKETADSIIHARVVKFCKTNATQVGRKKTNVEDQYFLKT